MTLPPDIEERLTRIEDNARLLLALKLLRDGHAPNLGHAMKMTADLEAVERLYQDDAAALEELQRPPFSYTNRS
jgi:hypothetical protein